MEVAQAEAEKQLRDEHNMSLLNTLDEKRRARQAEQVIHNLYTLLCKKYVALHAV